MGGTRGDADPVDGAGQTSCLVWRHDPFFSGAAVRRTADFVTGPYRLAELDAGHWLPEREPGAVVDAVQAAVLTPAR